MNNGKFEKFGIGIGALIIGALACCFVVAVTTIIISALFGPAGMMLFGIRMSP